MVRVCDTCYSKLGIQQSNDAQDLPLPRASSEDDDLARAIAASLEISKPIKPRVRFEPRVEYSDAPRQRESAESEEDEDLKRAIEASLQEANEYKRKQEARSATRRTTFAEYEVPTSSGNYSKPVRQKSSVSPPPQPATQSMTETELQSIRAFTELVERENQNVTANGIAVFNPYQLQVLFSQVSVLAPRLIKNLSDTAEKYKQFYDMNSEISAVVKEYDKLLMQRVAHSQQVSQVPANAPSYFPENRQAYVQQPYSAPPGYAYAPGMSAASVPAPQQASQAPQPSYATAPQVGYQPAQSYPQSSMIQQPFAPPSAPEQGFTSNLPYAPEASHLQHVQATYGQPGQQLAYAQQPPPNFQQNQQVQSAQQPPNAPASSEPPVAPQDAPLIEL